MQFMTANLIDRVFPAHGARAPVRVGRCAHDWEERRHYIVAPLVLRGRGMPAIVRDVEYTELFDWEEVADVAAPRERITDCLCWEGPTIPRPVLEGRVLR
ncbi:hypothetical protein TcBrA4_0060360 [Trypanosoma cruzi]|nr:hypothetical protein TcBrA4_0060360 [Trypanosoma cruzi]